MVLLLAAEWQDRRFLGVNWLSRGRRRAASEVGKSQYFQGPKMHIQGARDRSGYQSRIQ